MGDEAMMGERAVPCICNQIQCVCALIAGHETTCPFRVAALCPVSVECEHGYDVCPECDPCMCEELRKLQSKGSKR